MRLPMSSRRGRTPSSGQSMNNSPPACAPEWHLRSGAPCAGAIPEGLPVDLGRHGLAGSDDPLLVGKGGARMLITEHVEIGFADQFADRAARGVRSKPA